MPVLPFPQLILGTGERIGAALSEREVISLPAPALMHTWCIGKSGYGKSRWLCSLAVMLLAHGINFILIDPAGDLGRIVLRQLIALGFYDTEPDAFDKLLYLDIPAACAQHNCFLPFNILNSGFDPFTTADLVLESFKRAFPILKSGSSTNIESMLKACSHVLASHQLPLTQIIPLLTDMNYRQSLLSTIRDEFILAFFQQLTDDSGKLSLNIEATIKRLFLLLFPPVLRHSLSQTENVLHIRRILQEKKSVICNLNVADPDAMRLLGCLVTVMIETAAKAQSEIPAEQRSGTHMVIIDEYPTFSTQSGDSFCQILDQCRKMGVYLCLAHQSFTQVSPQLQGALRNCDIRAVFRVEETDAHAAAPLLGFPTDPFLLKPSLTHRPQIYSSYEQKRLHISAITQLDKAEAFLKLPGDRLYKMNALIVENPAIPQETLHAIEEEYRHRYFRPLAAIQRGIGVQLPEREEPTRSHPEGTLAAELEQPEQPASIFSFRKPI